MPQPKNDAIPREIEIKLALEDAGEAKRLRKILAPPVAEVTQENVYFDTPDAALSGVGWAVRMRCVDEKRVVLTIKGSTELVGAFRNQPEWEREFEGECWEELCNKSGAIGAATGELLRRSNAEMPAVIELDQLAPIGRTRTRRATFALPGAGPTHCIEIDETLYPNGQWLHEVELEIDGIEQAEGAEARLRAILEQARIPWRPKRITKLGQLRAILSECNQT